MSRVVKNNKAYDSGDVEVTLLGSKVNEVSEISYSTSQEHQLNYGLRNDATSWSRGKKSHEGTITLPMHEATAIEDAAKGNLLAIKPFDINVTFVNEYNKIINDTLTVKFAKQGREVTGDMGLSLQYDLFVIQIEYNNL